MTTVGEVVHLVDVVTGSAATLTHDDNGGWAVREGGPLKPWERIEHVLNSYDAAGRPGPETFTLHVSDSGQHLRHPQMPGLPLPRPRRAHTCRAPGGREQRPRPSQASLHTSRPPPVGSVSHGDHRADLHTSTCHRQPCTSSLAELVLDVFNRDPRLKDITAALATHLGSTLRARPWITDAIAAADRISRSHVEEPLDGLAEKW